MLLPSITLTEHPQKGLGLFASEFVPMGTVVWGPCQECSYYSSDQLNKLTKDAFQKLNELGYSTADNGILLPCSNACYMNHACEANVLDYGLDFGIAIKDIDVGEEVCCDYHTWEGEVWEMLCKCNSNSCLGTISPTRGNEKMKQRWAKQVELALTSVKQIKQPLHTQLLTSSKVYTQLLQGIFNYLTDKSISVKTNLGKNWDK